jgi:hypothetical protein
MPEAERVRASRVREIRRRGLMPARRRVAPVTTDSITEGRNEPERKSLIARRGPGHFGRPGGFAEQPRRDEKPLLNDRRDE